MSSIRTFRYDALLPDGRPFVGTIDAADEAAARTQLDALALTVRLFEPVSAATAAPLSAADLAAFNDQLAHLTQAGLPVEQGLRLLAKDLSRGRLKRAVAAVSAELDRGVALPEALAKHGRAFPPLYARLVAAGIHVGNLPAVLFNLGRHLEQSARLRTAITRAVAYPLMLLLGIVIVSAFLSNYVLPSVMGASAKNENAFRWVTSNPFGAQPPRPRTPLITQAALAFGQVAPWLAVGAIGLTVLLVVSWPVLRFTRIGSILRDSVFTRLPLIGRPLRFDAVGRWCDAAHIGITAGLPLPAALGLAGDVIASPRLSADSDRLAAAHAAGGAFASAMPLALLPAAVPAALDSAVKNNTLPQTLASLSTLYLQQAENRARVIPTILTPLLLLLAAVLMGGLLAAIFLPMTQLLNQIMN